jgi:hypothetical protein
VHMRTGAEGTGDDNRLRRNNFYSSDLRSVLISDNAVILYSFDL